MKRKMRASIRISCILAMVLLFTTSCSDERLGNKSGIKDFLSSMTNKDVMQEESIETTDAKVNIKSTYDKIDVDLTAMPKQLAYTTANRMNLVSEQYLGQVVKMNGICSIFHDEKRDVHFFTCEIKDETACCTLGIEFELVDDYKFPDDFPKENDYVTVVGTFDTYKEGARRYKTLRKAFLVEGDELYE